MKLFAVAFVACLVAIGHAQQQENLIKRAEEALKNNPELAGIRANIEKTLGQITETSSGLASRVSSLVAAARTNAQSTLSSQRSKRQIEIGLGGGGGGAGGAGAGAGVGFLGGVQANLVSFGARLKAAINRVNTALTGGVNSVIGGSQGARAQLKAQLRQLRSLYGQYFRAARAQLVRIPGLGNALNQVSAAARGGGAGGQRIVVEGQAREDTIRAEVRAREEAARAQARAQARAREEINRAESRAREEINRAEDRARNEVGRTEGRARDEVGRAEGTFGGRANGLSDAELNNLFDSLNNGGAGARAGLGGDREGGARFGGGLSLDY